MMLEGNDGCHMSRGETLVKSLVIERIKVIFGFPGKQIYCIVAAIRDAPVTRMVTTRHKQAATYMADGYGRASGKRGVAVVVPGVGLCNTASGLATAMAAPRPCSALPDRFRATKWARIWASFTRSQIKVLANLCLDTERLIHE